MSEPSVIVAKDARGVATVAINRPQVRNAIDDTVIRSLTDAFKTLGVQTVPPFQPLPDTHAQGLAHDLAVASILQPIVSFHRTPFSGPPLIRIDILDLTSLLRI